MISLFLTINFTCSYTVRSSKLCSFWQTYPQIYDISCCDNTKPFTKIVPSAIPVEINIYEPHNCIINFKYLSLALNCISPLYRLLRIARRVVFPAPLKTKKRKLLKQVSSLDRQIKWKEVTLCPSLESIFREF